MNYISSSHTEFASIGTYSDSYTEFGVKRVSSSEIAIKNKTNSSKTIKVSIATSVS
jgi:hypothetical protein